MRNTVEIIDAPSTTSPKSSPLHHCAASPVASDKCSQVRKITENVIVIAAVFE